MAKKESTIMQSLASYRKMMQGDYSEVTIDTVKFKAPKKSAHTDRSKR